jgi:hypothetical protein
MPGNIPGNGKTNPFGDGRGGAGESAPMPNDFNRNPAGGSRPGRAPRDFLRAPPNLARQTPKKDPDLNEQDAAPGPRTAAETPHANRPEAGVGSVGNAARPFKLGG